MIPDVVIDNGPKYLVDNCNLVVICSSEPASYAAAFNEASGGGVRIGSVAPSLSLQDGAVDGRRARMAALSGGTVEDDDAVGTNQWIACLDTVGSVLLATNELTNDQVVVDGNTFAVSAYDVYVVRDPA